MNDNFQNLILKNFNLAAQRYNEKAFLQKLIAEKLAQICSENNIPKGLWVDLGTGTGMLAESIEKHQINQTMLRIDNSDQMLEQHSSSNKILLWDLNQGLPNWDTKPKLLASSFALHWLNNPLEKVRDWSNSLAKNGWMAIAVPIEGSFPEWRRASNNANVAFNAFPFPSESGIINSLKGTKIKYQSIETFTQKDSKVFPLLKSIIDIGGQTSTQPKLKVGELKKLIQSWPREKESQKFNLTWLIQIILTQK